MKRTKDGRIIEDRILMDKKVLRKIIYSAKKNLTRKELSKKLKVNQIMLQHEWLLENRTIPSSSFYKLLRLSGFSNYKNEYKYKEFLKKDKVPTNSEVEMFIRHKAGI